MILRFLIVISLYLFFTTPVHAYESGDLVVRAGAIKIATHENSSALRLNGVSLAGTGISVNNDTQPGLAVSYAFNSHWGVGFVLAPPFKHTIRTKGWGGIKVGTAKQLPAVVTAQYFFDSVVGIKPYIGAGINYTVFFAEDEHSELKNNLGGAENLSFESSTGLVLELGVDVPINEAWLVNAAVWQIDIDSKGSVDTGAGKVAVDVQLDPWVYMLGVGYRF